MKPLLEQLKEIRGQRTNEQSLNQTVVTWREFTPVLDAVIGLLDTAVIPRSFPKPSTPGEQTASELADRIKNVKK